MIVTSVLVGITEPFEFLFIFTAPLLWLIYSPAGRFFPDAGLACFTSGSAPLTVSSISSSITSPAGVSATRWPVFVALGLLETATMYLVGTFCITRLRLLTPGRETAAEDEHSQQANSEHPDKGALVIAGLGGKENVCAVGNCFTRLRIDVRDPRPYPTDAVERERREQRAD
ncbi:PTS system glucose-like IIBC component [Klebsiella pneumoniae]|uniref:PTS system glucose-like IIBC component n=1 Tax=Klebsiella pneumoniae TaxID=573 RepID=A0A3S4KBL8_KLEPN|nr:PTS system glucose-like IIBC component [Klebsiella pneumoniae]